MPVQGDFCLAYGSNIIVDPKQNAKNLGAYARQGSNYSVCPFSPIDSRGRVVILLNICAPTRTLHTDALR